ALRQGRRAALLRSSLRLLRDRSQLEHVELGRALRPRDHQPPAKRADPLEHARHVALGVVAIGDRQVFAAKSETAEEDQAIGIIVLPQPPGGPLTAGLLDDRQQVTFDLDVAEERLEALEYA